MMPSAGLLSRASFLLRLRRTALVASWDPPTSISRSAFRPQAEEVIAAIAAAARDTGKIAGVHANSLDDAKRHIRQVFRFVTAMAETRMIRAGATEVLKALRT